MQSKTTRIAYLKRMLKRLDAEELRIQQLVSAGELSSEGGELGIQQLKNDREKLRSELLTLRQIET